jgi:hypothetical protein
MPQIHQFLLKTDCLKTMPALPVFTMIKVMQDDDKLQHTSLCGVKKQTAHDYMCTQIHHNIGEQCTSVISTIQAQNVHITVTKQLKEKTLTSSCFSLLQSASRMG